jgi:hypothetical protein
MKLQVGRDSRWLRRNMRNRVTAILVFLVPAFVSLGGHAQTVVPADYDIDVSVTSTWTQTPLYVIAGDTLFLYASGVVGAGADPIDWRDWSGPDGAYPSQAGGCSDCPLPGYPLRALIARIGDGQPFLVGSFAAVVADFSGMLHIGINENSPGQNTGTMTLFIWRRGDILTAVDDRTPTPRSFVELYQNVPNPFNPTTRIRFYLPKQARVTLDVFDVSGRLVIRLLDGVQPAGENSVVWMGRDKRGVPAASGIYFYRLRAGGYAGTRKMILLR